MRPILKNTNKYTNISLCRGIILTNKPYTKRYVKSRNHSAVGISSSLYGDRWFILPKGRAIFKSYESQEITKNNRIVNELICQEISKQIGLNCANYELASYKGEKGLVSYDVTKDGETLLNGKELFLKMGILRYDNCIELYKDAIKRYKTLNPQIDTKQIILDLYKIAIFDAITFQTDRHINNLFFIKEKNGNLRVSPLIDNELSFCSNRLLLNTMLNTIFKQDLLDDFLDTDIKFFVYKNTDLTSYPNYIKNILKFAFTNKEARQIVNGFLKNIDISKAIENVEKKGIIINDGYKEYLTKLTKISTSTMKKIIKEHDNNLKNNIEKEG